MLHPPPRWVPLRPGPPIRAPPGRKQVCCPCTTQPGLNTHVTPRSASLGSHFFLSLPVQTLGIRPRGPPYKLPQCQHLPLRQLPPHQSRQRRGQRLVGFSLWAQPQAALCAEAPGSQFRGVSREQGFRHSREPVNPAHSVSCRWGEGVCVHD